MHLSPLRFALAAVLALPVIPLVHCTSTSTTPPSMGVIGPAGGSLASTDYAIEITVPPGALTENLDFTITGPITTIADAGVVVQAPMYSVSACPPSGTCTPPQVNQPLVISYTQQAIVTNNYLIQDWSDYRVGYYTAPPDAGLSGTWSLLPNQSVDSVAQTVQATTMDLSSTVYGAFIPPLSKMCETVTEPSYANDGGCAPVVAVPGKCAPYPGSVTNTCATDASGIIQVECCYPTGAPVCFAQSEKGCDSPCAAVPGSTAMSCMTVTLEDASTTSESTCCLTDPTAPPTCTAMSGSSCAGTSPCDAGFVGSCVDVGSQGYWACCSFDGGTAANDAGAADSGSESDAGTSTSDAAASDGGATPDAATDAGVADAGAGTG